MLLDLRLFEERMEEEETQQVLRQIIVKICAIESENLQQYLAPFQKSGY
jgi:hypothetical protein